MSLLITGDAFGANRVLYVNVYGGGPGYRDGTSWARGFTSIDAALYQASTIASAAQPVEIWVPSGTYRTVERGGTARGGFQLASHVRLIGGFAGTETSSNQRNGARPTVLTADVNATMLGAVTDLDPSPAQGARLDDPGWKDNVKNVLVGDRVTDVVLDGLTITGGSAIASPTAIPQIDLDGMEMYAGQETDADSLVKTVVELSSRVAGGGLYFTAPARNDPNAPVDLVITRCVFTRNHARGSGGAVVLRDALAAILDTSFSDNSADLNGGAISALNCLLDVEYCTFTGNQGASDAGAVDLKSFPTAAPLVPDNFIPPDQLSHTPGGQGSDRDKARTGIGYAISGLMAIKKASAIYSTPGGIGAKFKTALPTNPFGEGLSPGARIGAAYAGITIAVSLGDTGVTLAKLFGVDPNDQNIKNWETFSYYFNTYATPQGLLALGFEQLIIAAKNAGFDLEDLSVPSYAARTAVKRQEGNNYNAAPYSVFLGCQFRSNSTTGDGGALQAIYANARVENSYFSGNVANTNGGAISAAGYTTPKIINSVFQKNFSYYGHSAVANSDHSQAQVLNCTFYQNTSRSAAGYALTSERGSSVRVSNSVFWGNVNADAANTTGGADVFAASAGTLDTDSRALYDAGKGDRVDWIGTMELRNCDLQSLARIPLGTGNEYINIFPGSGPYTNTQINIQLAYYRRVEASGDTESGGIVNSGEGVRSNLRDADQANFSKEPVFTPNTVSPSAASPLIDAGSDARLNGNNTHPFTAVDANNAPRRVGGAVDVGAVEAQPQVEAQIEVAQPGNDDWTYRRVFVKPTATGNGSGNSWANATNKLGAAMNSLGAEVWVAAGTYKPAVANREIALILANGTRVYGGFAGTETTRDQRQWKVNQTIVSGDLGAPDNFTDNSKHLVTCADVSGGATLDGIYFQDSYSADDHNTGEYTLGGAVAALRSSPTISNCVFQRNWSQQGGAVWSHGAIGRGPTITGCEFYNNTANDSGGALFYDSSAWVTNCRFFGNKATTGGALAVTAGGYGIVQQCLLWGNKADKGIAGNTVNVGFGGAIFAASDALTITGSTIYGNQSNAVLTGAVANGGGGVYYATATASAGSVSVTNSILIGNVTNSPDAGRSATEKNQLSVGSTESVLFDHCIVQGLNRYVGAAYYANFDADPQFAAPSKTLGADFTLRGNSSAINAGNANAGYALPTDLAGAPRVANGGVDLGPYEYVGPIPSGGVGGVLSATRSGASGATVNRFAVALPTGSSVFQWQVDRGDGVWVSLTADGVYSGVNSATLTITGAPYAQNGWRFRLTYNVPGFDLTYYSAISQLKVGLPRIYVNANATGANDGSSWSNAYPSLRDALDVAEAGSEVWVAAGTYYPTRTSDPANTSTSLGLRSGVAIYGGFSGGESQLSQRNPRSNVTVVSGNLSAQPGFSTARNSETLFRNDGSTLSGACDRTAILDGFTLSDATKYGVYNYAASPTIRQCVFQNNLGSAVLDWNGSNAFIGNSEFRANTGASGPALYNGDSSAVIENCLFADNVSTYTGIYGGAVQFVGTGNSTVTNCTFANNSAVSSGAALVVSGSGNVAVRNSVAWGNKVADTRTPAAQVAVARSGGTLTLANNCLQGATSTANGNFTLDPLFLDPANGNYQTARISPLRNAASSTYPTVSTVDLLGNGRNFSGVDIGAYEATDGAILGVKIVSLPPSSVKVKSAGGGTAFFSLVMPTGTSANFTWQVNLNDSGGWVNVTSGGRYQITADGGSSTLTITGLTVADNGIQARIVNSNYSYASPGSKLTVIVPTLLYVNGAAVGSNNGQSWANAYTNLAAALNAATEKNEVWVAQGTYTTPATASFAPPQNVEIYGGFSGGETTRTSRDWQAHPTILHPSAGLPTVNCEFSATGASENYSVLDGFVLENATSAGAAYVHQRSEFFANCVFRNNVLGVVNTNANPTFTNCVFSGGTSSAVKSTQANATFANCRFQDFVLDENTSVAPTYGSNEPSTTRFTDCVFARNNAGSSILGNRANLTVTRCQFLDNVGSGIAEYGNSVFTVESSLFARNYSGGSGSAIYNSSSSLAVQNCTLADNSVGSNGAAVYSDRLAKSTVVLNSVLWGNRVATMAVAPSLENQQIASETGTPSVTYCIVEGLSALGGMGNQKYAPLFVEEGGGDYHLNSSSPAVSKAQRTALNSTSKDLDGLPRFVGSGQDVGAYELQGAQSSSIQLTQAPKSTSTPVLSKVAFTFEGSLNFHWQVFDAATQTWKDVDPSSPDYQVVVNGQASSLVVLSASLGLNGTQFRVRELPGLPVTLTVLPPQVFYVDGGMAVSGDGKSWSAAFKTVQEAVNASVAISATASAEVWVKKGTYPVGTASSALKMSWQIQLYGGFAGTESSRAQRDWVKNVTTFTSAGSGVMIQDFGNSFSGYNGQRGNSLLDGFTVSGAGQSGYSIYQSSPTVRNCVFDGAASGVDVVQDASPTFQGCTFQNLSRTALRASGNGFVVDHCAFQNNTSRDGVVTVSVGSCTITDSRFTGNSGGPVLSFTGSTAATVKISRSVFTGNTTLYDLITLYPQISLDMDNSLIADNQTTSGSVVQCEGATVNISYCTIANNRHQASAIGVGRASQTSVRYSILWGNRNTRPLDQRQQQGVTDLPTAQACLLPNASGATLSVYRGIQEGLGDGDNNENLGFDPLFANFTAGDYRLSGNSPAVNRGDSYNATALGTLDLAGAPRIYPLPSGYADLGAYEFQSAPSTTLKIYGDYGSKRVVVGTSAAFTFTAANDPVQWQVDKGDGKGFVNLSAGGGVTIHPGNLESLMLSNVTFAMSGYEYRFIISGAHPYTSPGATLTVVAKPIRYVNLAATGTGDGTSWANAYPNLLTALSVIDTSNTNGNSEVTADIWVAKGTYDFGTATGTLSRGVEIYGGFVGGETSRDARNSVANVTTVTGRTGMFYYMDKPDSIYGDPIIDGLTLTGTGKGISKYGGNLTVRNCRFVAFTSASIVNKGGTLLVTGSIFSGGAGAYIQATSPTGMSVVNLGNVLIQHSRFENGTDAAIYCGAGTLAVEDSIFQNNRSTRGGGPALGLYDSQATTNLNRCQFLGNTEADDTGSSLSGGAICVQAGTLTIRQSLFAGNRGYHAGAIASSGMVKMYGVTAADNTVSSTDYAGVVYQSGGYCLASNGIFWGNKAERAFGTALLSQVVKSGSVGGGVSNTAMENAYLIFGTGSLGISYDPQFVGGGNYRLKPNSPYIGRGDTSNPNVLSGETDLAGNNRVTSGKTDYGAYQNGVAINTLAVTSPPPTAVTQAIGGNIVLTLGGAPGYTYTWQFSDDGGVTWKSLGQLPSYVANSAVVQFGVATLTISGVPISLSGYQFRVSVDGASYATTPTTVTVVPPEPIYVDASSTTVGDGMSWATAYHSLDTAIAAVTVMRRIIYVAEGTYVPAGSFSINKRMEIYGGYPAGGDTVTAPRDPVAHPTVLSGLIPGSSSRRETVVSVYGGDYRTDPVSAIQGDTLLDGLTIQDGQRGMDFNFANPTLRNLTVQGNSNGGLAGFYLGGLIEDCRFLGNTRDIGAGASFGTRCSVTISRSVFQDNVATYRSGGLEISENTSGIAATHIKLANVVVSGNTAGQSGGGMSVYASRPIIESSVFTGNRAGVSGGGIFVSQSLATLENSILWANRSTGGTLEAQQLDDDLQGNGYSVLASDIEGVSRFAGGAMGVDPLFLSGIAATDAPTLAGDFRLNSSSPLINTGNNAYATSQIDLAGFPRLYGTVDLGAYEYQGDPDAPLVFTRQPQDLLFSRLTGAANQFHIELAASTFAYQWELSKDGVTFTDVGDARFGGAQTNTLTVLVGDPTLEGTRFRCRVTANAGGIARSLSAKLTVFPARYYVNARAANDKGDGFTWGTAMKTLARATGTLRIDPATGVEVWVSAGTYVTTDGTDTNATFALPDKVSLYGGFAGNETALTARDPAANPTILNGVSGTVAIITRSTTGSALVDGFNIGNGITGIVSGTAPIPYDGPTPLTVAHCSFTNLVRGITKATGRSNSGNDQGLTVQGSRFTGLSEAGVVSSNGPLVVADSTFIGNGQGITHAGGFVQILRSEFRANGGPGVNGGAVSLDHTPAYSGVEDSLFSGNRARNGGGIYAQAGNVVVSNSTFAGNYAESYAGGVYFTNGGQGGALDLYNSILWNNASTAQGTTELGQVVGVGNAYNNDVQNAALQTGKFRASNGNVSVDPAFVQTVAASPATTAAGDFRLSSLSPLVNLGSNAYLGASATDLAGNARTFGPAVDLGAYEFQKTVLVITSQPADATAGSGVPARFSVATNAGDASYQWQVSTDGSLTFANLGNTSTEQGVNTATLTVAGVPAYDGRRYRVQVTTPQPGAATSTAAAYHYYSLTPQLGISLAQTLTGTTTSTGFTLSGRTVDSTSVTDASFAVHAMQTGRIGLQSGLSVAGGTVTLTPGTPFKAGELVEVTATSAVRDTLGYHIDPLVYQFRAGSTSRYGIFPQTQTIGSVPTGAKAMAVGDLNGDGTVDLIVGGANGATVLLNNGDLTFTTGQTVSSGAVAKLVLGSLGFPGSPGGRLDLVLIKADGAVEVWKNGGVGTFTQTATLAGVVGTAVGVGDFNGDGALDLFIATAGADQVWFNNGYGTFVDSQQRLGTGAGVSVAVGALNNRRCLDVVVANGTGNLEAWANNGVGVFSATSFSSEASPADRVFLADADRNGILDVLTVRGGLPVKLWISYAGNFRSQPLNGTNGSGAGWTCVGDVDGDGRPDVIAASAYDGTATLRRGAGYNSATGYTDLPLLPEQPALSISGVADLADLDGDGRMDLVSVSPNGTVQAATYEVIDQTIDENGSGSLTAAAFQMIYNGTPTFGTGRTLAAIQIASLPTGGTLKQSGAAVSIGQVIPVGALALTFVPAHNFFGFTSFAWQGSTDGATFGAESYRDNVLVTHVPQAVHPQADFFTLQQGGMLSDNVLTNDNNGDPLTAKVLVPPAHGTVTMAADGAFTYTHDNSENPRADQFTYQVTDTANHDTATAVVSLTITNRNDPPSDITFSDAYLYERVDFGTVVGVLTGTDPDAGYDGGTVTLSLVNGVLDNARFTIDGQNLKTNAVLNYADGPTRTVRVRATDDLGLSIDRDLTVRLKARPEALAQAVTGLEEHDVYVTLAGSCADGRAITSYAIVTRPQHGSLYVDGTRVLYVPTALYSGPDSFTYTVSDGTVDSDPATVAISLTHVNHPPTPNLRTLVVTENVPLNFTVTGNDVDNDPLTFEILGSSPKGTITGTSPNFTFTPALDQTGDFQFLLLAHDGTTTWQDDYRRGVYIQGTINQVDYPPVIAALQSYSMPENDFLQVPLSATDRNGRLLTYRITAQPAHGKVTSGGDKALYLPDRNYSGPDSFQYVANNGVYDSAASTVAIEVQHVNQPPVAVAMQYTTGQLQEISFTLFGVDSDKDPLSYAITRPPQHGTLTGSGNYRTYTPTGLYHGADQLEFSVTDGEYTSTAIIDITINERDLKPTADAQTIAGYTNEASTFTLTASDPKGLPLTYRIVGLPQHGTLTGSLPGPMTYTPEQRYYGADMLTFLVNNGKLDSDPATVTINVAKNLQNGPTLQDDYVENVFKNESRVLDVLANDSDFYGDPLEIIAVTTPTSGSVVISEDRKSLLYTATDVTAPGYAFFQYTVSNGSPDTRTAAVFVQVVNQHLVVNSPQDSGPGTLREAVATIQGSSRPNSPDWVITFLPNIPHQGVQLNTGDPNDPDSALVISGNVNLVAGSAPSPVVRVNSGAVPLRAFHVLPGGTLRLNGVILSGGKAHRGGAILNEGSLAIDGTTLTANTAFAVAGELGLGGAIYTTGALNLTNATLIANVADTAGGFYQLGDGTAASTVINTATLSGHGAADDFLSVAVNGGTASIESTALTVETPTAPWFGALPATATVARQFRTKVPVVLDGDAYALTATSSNPDFSYVAWTGRGTQRTLTLGGFTPAYGAQTRLTATASNGSVSYVQHTDITVDPASSRAPVATDDHAALPSGGSVLIPVLANDYDPDGGPLKIDSVTLPDSGGSLTIEDGKIRFTHDGDTSSVFYSFTYTVRNAASLTATATVSIRRVADYNLYVVSGADSGSNTLREALDMVNQYYAAGGWTILINGNLASANGIHFASGNGGAMLTPSTVADRGVGASAYLVTGNATIDASATPGLTIQRDPDGPSMRLFRVTDTGSLTLKNVVVDGGVANHGGAILNEGTLKLDHSTVQNGVAVVGGGVFNEGTLKTETAMLTGNAASSFGGALYNRNGSAMLSSSTLSNNTAIDGGGVHLFGDGDGSLVRLFNTMVNNPAAPHDLSATVTGSGTTVLTASGNTTVAAPGDTWVNPIADGFVNDTLSVPFTFTAPATATISAKTGNEAVVATSGLSFTDLTPTSGTLQIRARAAGFADVSVLANKGATAFGQSFALTVNSALNSPPLAVDDAVTVYQGAQATINVLDNDSDPEGAPLLLLSVGTALHGTAVQNGASVVYAHDGSATTADTFTYVVSDGFGGTATGRVNVTIQETKLSITSTDSGGGLGSLRQAMEFAAAHPTTGTWQIVFDPSIPANSTIYYGNYGPYYNGYTMFHVAGNVLLDGSRVPGLRIESSGGQYGPPVRFFHVQSGASLELRSLVLSKGVVQVTGSPEEGLVGGGGVVLNEGTLVARNVTFLNNRAPGNVGGAIASSGVATIAGCTFTGNTATLGTDHSARQLGTGLGGAIFQLNGTLTVTDSTFTDNAASDGAGIYTAGDVEAAQLNLAGSNLASSTSASSQVRLAVTNGGAVTRNSARNALPDGETAPWIGSIVDTTSLSGPTDLQVTLGVPTDAYTLTASATPSASLSSIHLTGDGGSRTLSVEPASGAYGPLDLKVTLVNGPLTVNETFASVIAAPAPAAPTGLTATAVSDSQIALAWTSNATNAGSYSVERSSNGVDGWTIVTATLPANTTRYVDSALTASTQQFYRVRCDLAGTASDYSNVVTAMTAVAINDGIPGWWRYLYFGDGTRIVHGAEPGADPDGDGLTNLQEYVMGTAPTDAASALRLQLTRTDNTPVLSFPSVLGKVYRIEVAGSLDASATWNVLVDNLAGTNGIVSHIDTVASDQPQRFYRIVVHP